MVHREMKNPGHINALGGTIGKITSYGKSVDLWSFSAGHCFSSGMNIYDDKVVIVPAVFSIGRILKKLLGFVFRYLSDFIIFLSLYILRIVTIRISQRKIPEPMRIFVKIFVSR